MKVFCKVILISTLILAYAVEGHAAATLNDCAAHLRADVSEYEYFAALAKTEITRSTYVAAEEKIARRAARLGLNPSQIDLFRKAVIYRITGYDEISQKVLAEFKSRSDSMSQKVKRLASDPEVAQPIMMLDFINANAPPVELMLFNYRKLFPDLEIGPRQAEMVRTVLQYAQTHRDDRILEIGYGSPSVLLALANYTSTLGIGVDPNAPWSESNDELIRYRTRVIAGQFLDSDVLRYLDGFSPFAVIYAQDVFTKTLEPELLAAAYDRLKPGGVLIFMNDHGRTPKMNHAVLEKIGFTLDRAAEVIEIPKVWKKLTSYAPKSVDAGKLMVVVLRKGHAKLHHETLHRGDGRAVVTKYY